jgi:hypothetical protein
MARKPIMARYNVKAWYSWADIGAGRYAINADFSTREQALAAARASDCPLIDVVELGHGIIAERELLRHPQLAEAADWKPRDTLGI